MNNQKTAWLFISLSAIVLSLLGTSCFYSIVGAKPPRKAKHEIPVTNLLTWGQDRYQQNIDSFAVRILDSRLNLFNNTSLISYSVYAHVNNTKDFKYEIDRVHISERTLAKDSTNDIDAELIITPLFKSKTNKLKKAGIEKVSFTNEHQIQSLHWGINRIRLVCGKFAQVITLSQHK